MKAKYILRGLGLGMIITAVVMGAYTRSAVAAARVDVLKEYGIGDEVMLAETGDEVMLAETLVDVGGDTDIETQESEPANAAESEADMEAAATEATEQVIERDEEIESQINSVPDGAVAAEQGAVTDSQTAGKESESAIEEASSGDTQIKDEQMHTVTITISKGDDSGTVSRKLYNAGLVENAAEYDAFLMQHGYDKKLNTGAKIISVNDTWQEMAEKLTR